MDLLSLYPDTAYLHQGDYVFGAVYLFVCLSAGLWETTSLISMKHAGRM